MKYENLIMNPDKQVNKVGSTKWETEYNSTASKRIDEMSRNATNPIDIKENQMKKGTKLSSRMSCPACVPMLRERTRFLCFAYQ